MFKRKETPAVCRNTGAGVFFINRLKSKWEGKRMQNETAKENLLRQIREYRPYNEQEERDRAILLKWMESGCDILTRENETAHLTASAWVVSPDRKQVLMAYHNIYHSWAWLGGHADGDADLCSVAVREVKEESGIRNPVGGRPCEARKVRDDTSPSECDISHGSRPGTGNPLQAG